MSCPVVPDLQRVDSMLHHPSRLQRHHGNRLGMLWKSSLNRWAYGTGTTVLLIFHALHSKLLRSAVRSPSAPYSGRHQTEEIARSAQIKWLNPRFGARTATRRSFRVTRESLNHLDLLNSRMSSFWPSDSVRIDATAESVSTSAGFFSPCNHAPERGI